MTAVGVEQQYWGEEKRILRRSVVSAFIDTIVLFGALGWIYVAAVAIFEPGDLSERLTGCVPMRRDTFGIISFGVSASAHFIQGIYVNGGLDRYGELFNLFVGLPRCVQRENSQVYAVILAVLRTLFVYSTFGFAYLVMNSITHPETLDMSLTHFLDWPTEKTALAIALFLSVSSYFFGRAAAHWGYSRVHRMVEGNQC